MTRANAAVGGTARLAGALILAATVLGGRAVPAHADESRMFTFIEADQIEYRVGHGKDLVGWDVQGWFGGDYHKAWIKTRGRDRVNGPMDGAEMQLLYSRVIAAFWDLQIGARYDVKPNPSRGHAVLGVRGLAPYFIEVDAAAFVSHKGEVSARLEAEYDLLLTQRLIAKPSVEINVAGQEVDELRVGAGVRDVELGFRLRYELLREVAPYVGVSWERMLGPTADFARRDGKDAENLTVLTGVRFWF